MDLRTALSQVPVLGYTHRESKQQAAQKALYEIGRSQIDGTPLGLKIRVSGQAASLPLAPWIAFVDTDITKTATKGMYLVYLYSTDLKSVFLTLNQGATARQAFYKERGLKPRAAELAAIDDLRNESRVLRSSLESAGLLTPSDPIDLGSDRFLPAAYEAGTIACKAYPTHDLPVTDELQHDLASFAQLYSSAATFRDQLVASDPQQFYVPTREQAHKPKADIFFRPKDSSDYIVHVSAGYQRRSRKHEALLELFASTVSANGWTPNSNVHPRDLEVTRPGGPTWLVEAKTVGPNAELAVREAIGQLFTYRHFWYRSKEEADPRLLALFSEPIGQAFIDALAPLGIDVIWRDGNAWRPTDDASELVGA